jgi:Na+-translocating ferredoxin:NAD+ oxidoreductase RnfD subunit
MQDSEQKSLFKISSVWYFITLLPVYLAAWGRFGQKVPAGVVLSLATALFIWLIGIKRNSAVSGFPWGLFFCFSLFVPLGMPLWLVPVALTGGWLIAVTCFGGYGKNIFNPVVIALVILITGYGTSVSLQASKPFPGACEAFSVWTAGINPSVNENQLALKRKGNDLWSLLSGGTNPSLPGLAFPGPLFLIALLTGLLFSGRRSWTLAVPVFTIIWAMVFNQIFQNIEITPLAILMTGIVPGLMIVSLADGNTVPDSLTGQVFHATFLGLFSVIFTSFSPLMIYAVFALLLTQVLFPFLTQMIKWKQKNE